MKLDSHRLDLSVSPWKNSETCWKVLQIYYQLLHHRVLDVTALYHWAFDVTLL